MARYHYTECGLPNVWIENIKVHMDDAGESVYHIPNITGLHRAIAETIVTSQKGITGPELRFLRTEMGQTQAELANTLHKEGLTIGRWERGEHPIDENAETVIRLLAIEALGLSERPVSEIAKWSLASAMLREIHIDGSDPDNYRAAA